MKKIIGILCATLLLHGCAAYKLGTYQTVDVSSTPTNATCKFLNSKGVAFSTLNTNGRIYNLRRSPNPIDVVCSKEGYADTTVVLTSDNVGEANGLMFVTAGADIILGTTYTYPSELHIVLNRN